MSKTVAKLEFKIIPMPPIEAEAKNQQSTNGVQQTLQVPLKLNPFD
jgi:hypothetical protein